MHLTVFDYLILENLGLMNDTTKEKRRAVIASLIERRAINQPIDARTVKKLMAQSNLTFADFTQSEIVNISKYLSS